MTSYDNRIPCRVSPRGGAESSTLGNGKPTPSSSSLPIIGRSFRYRYSSCYCTWKETSRAAVRRRRGRPVASRRSAMAGSDLLPPDPPCPGLAIVIMGVSGCGKSTVAAMLADALGCGFVEADDYHSEANKAKMSKGTPLTDDDRLPWLESLRDAIGERLGRGEDVAVSCSALRLKYREVLREGDKDYKPGSYETCRVKFVCLEASAEVIARRVARRAAEVGHFMPASLVQSQLDLLEIDVAEGITVADATVPANAIVEATIAQFRDKLASTVC